MPSHLTFGVGLLGLAWWLISRALKRQQKVKVIPRGKALTVREPDEISVLCFNVLADNLVRSNPCYNSANELYRSWEYRWDRLQEEITITKADIVCLQEVEIQRWNDWRGFMESLGYTGIMLKRNRRSNKTNEHHSITNATFFKKKRFTKCWEEHKNRVLGIALKWKTVADNEQKIYVINVHLEGHPYKPSDRWNQVRTALRSMEKEQGPSSETSDVIFCGDFNSMRHNAPWNYLYRGRLEAGYTEAEFPDIEVVKETSVHPYALQDVYKTAQAIPEFTTRAPRRRQEVDFMFCSRHLKVGGVLRSVDPRLVPSVDRILLPNRLTPSDHFPIGAVLLLSRANVDLRDFCRAPSSFPDPRFEAEVCCARVGNSVSSDHANNIHTNSSIEKKEHGESFHETTRAQKKFLETFVMP